MCIKDFDSEVKKKILLITRNGQNWGLPGKRSQSAPCVFSLTGNLGRGKEGCKVKWEMPRCRRGRETRDKEWETWPCDRRTLYMWVEAATWNPSFYTINMCGYNLKQSNKNTTVINAFTWRCCEVIELRYPRRGGRASSKSMLMKSLKSPSHRVHLRLPEAVGDMVSHCFTSGQCQFKNTKTF